MELTYYQRIGAENLQALVAYFYEEIKQDSVLRPMYPGDLEAAERRLFMFLVQYLGGPATYSERRGHPRLRMRHQVFPIDTDARDRWLNCMSIAMKKVTMDEESRKFLWAYFANTAEFLRNK
ncbi:MAG: cyanoglobin [Bacteroidetes bacterium]|jgi:hemoglobin|nr:cyanoglobin [Bacteroidota bacterium]MBU1581021.1 cyanoglobin [Bacteroidota bacterium]MBU2466897.1 cyanoglobin [Bacteroidota bacterium]MBU2559007.1 cyanoglobin [Bacteroidota bacterium]MDA3944659.1 cyanoglobin [Bacteroidota bacterium]